jgi:DNA-directed RNA polymerase specialized sigma24 family protein
MPIVTMKHLYQLTTGDLATHQRTIAAQVARLDTRRQRILMRAVAGASLRQIAAEEGVSHGSVQSLIRKSLEATRKAIAGEPRYNRRGRKRRVESSA